MARSWKIARITLLMPSLLIVLWLYFNNTASSSSSLLKTSKRSFEFIRLSINDPQQSEQVQIVWRKLVSQFVPLPLDNFGGSHAIPLLAALVLTDGSVLELGCGYSSTPILHNVSLATDRYLLSVDSNNYWMENVSLSLSKSPYHKFEQAIDWAEIGNDREWSVVLVDNAPEERRIHDVIKYAYRSKVLLLHDSESAGYLYDKAAPFFPHKYRHQHLKAYTDVWSIRNALLIAKIRYLTELTLEWQLPRQIIKEKNTNQSVSI